MTAVDAPKNAVLRLLTSPLRTRLGRLFAFEWRKLLSRRLPVVAFVLVVLVALLAPKLGHVVETASSLARTGRVASASPYENGWTALAGAVTTTRMFLMIVVLVLASSSVAEETTQGTLQALLVRPYRRVEVLAIKLLAIWSYAALLLLLAIGMAAAGAEATRGLYDVVTPEHSKLVHAFGDMWGYVYLATALTLAALFALTALGLLCSVIFDHPGYATGVAIGSVFLLSAISNLSDVSEALFVSYLGEPFEVVDSLARQFTNFKKRLSPGAVLSGIFVSGIWGAGLFAAGALLLGRRDVGK